MNKPQPTEQEQTILDQIQTLYQTLNQGRAEHYSLPAWFGLTADENSDLT